MTIFNQRPFSSLRRLGALKGVQDSSLAMADQLVASITNFATGVIVGRACSQDEFGLYMLGLSIVLAGMHLQNSMILEPYTVLSPRFSGRDHDAYFGSNLLIQIFFSVAAAAVLVAAGTVAGAVSPASGIVTVIWTLAAVLSFILLREFARKTCFAHLDYRTALILDVVVAVGQISTLLYLASNGWITAARAYMVIGVVTAAAGLVWLAGCLKGAMLHISRLGSTLSSNWGLGRWLFGSTLLWESNILLYPWLLAAFHGTAATGVWAAGFGVISMANPVLLGMQNLVGPKMAHSYAEGGKKALDRYLIRATAVFTILVAPLSAFLFFFADWVIVFIYGVEYTGRGIVIMPLAIDLLMAPALFAVARALVVIDRAKVDFLTNWISLLVFVFLGIYLTETYSYFGVALGVFIGKTAVTCAKVIAYVWFSESRIGEQR